MTINIGIATSPFRESFQKAFEQEIEIVKPNSKLDEILKYDLIIFSGGEDINPRIYGESITYTRGISIERDKIELDILSKAMALDIKVFGVCRGHQLINAKLGGKLLQDLFMGQNPSLHHSSPHGIEKISSDVFLKDIDIVNSLHHQGVISSGKGLQVTSKYRGIVESTMGKNVYTVQFHPEFMLGVKEIREFFTFFKSYVEENIKKKDPSKVVLTEHPYRISTSFVPFEHLIKRSRDVNEFIIYVRENSNLRNTDLTLQISQDQRDHLERNYERKNQLNEELISYNDRDEELYSRMEEGYFDSDDELREMENERQDIADWTENNLNEIQNINNYLMRVALEMQEMINNYNPSEESSVYSSIIENVSSSSTNIDFSRFTNNS